MYFIYKKQINVASEYSYNVDSIVEWFKDYIDQDDIIEAYGGVEEVTAKDIVDDIIGHERIHMEQSRRKGDIEYKKVNGYYDFVLENYLDIYNDSGKSDSVF